MDFLNEGHLVYAPCPEKAFVPGRIAKIHDDGTVVVTLDHAIHSTDDTRRVARVDIRPRFAQRGESTSQDNTSLVHLNDATILENLCARHRQDQIYTYTASVLLAVNPYKEIGGLYGDEQCALYRGRHIGSLPPHPYAIADTAYRALVRERRNQGLLISGESGAGKTETAKIVMQYLSFASGATSDLATRIQARVLQAQPILESFGNAVTMRNSNSSRFGKYTRAFFNEAGTLVDAGITTYLLESSRVVVHDERERTYHCFYEMLAGLGDEKLLELELQRGGGHRILAAGSSTSGGATTEPALPGLESRDARNFQRLCDALRMVGLDAEAVNSMIEVLAGLVHLGDIPKDEGSSLTDDCEDDETKTVDVNEDRVDAAARLLGMDPDALRATLKRKKLSVPGRNSFHEVPRTEAQLRQALHSLIKALYKRMFERTVQRINSSFSELRPGGILAGIGSQSSWRHIGILDIYGFERLQRNSFEQLCINLANERLQQYFVENVLVAEQSLYKREGLPWVGLSLPDSQPVVNCISQVFRTLDEYSQQLAKGVGTANDERFCQKTVDEATRCSLRRDVLKQLKMSGKRRSSQSQGPAMNEGFVIRHYAGGVEYNTRGWLEKNNDRLLAECEVLICESASSLVRSLAEEDQGKAVFRSISKKYTADLEALLKMLGTCDLHYIRCFKPNEDQMPNIFDHNLVLDQIVQCGTVELVRIMHDGFPNRCCFEEVTARFRDLLPERFQRYGIRTFIEALMLVHEVPKTEWALGMSRLFLKAGQLRALEAMRSEGAKPKVENLAKIVRSIIRKRWVRAGLAVQLCNYIPKFISRRREQRRLARQRFRCHVRVILFARSAWARIREKRMERLVRALTLGAFLYVWIRPKLVVAGHRARETVARRHQLERELERQRDRERAGEGQKEASITSGSYAPQAFLEPLGAAPEETPEGACQVALGLVNSANRSAEDAVTNTEMCNVNPANTPKDREDTIIAERVAPIGHESCDVDPASPAADSQSYMLAQQEIAVQMDERIKALEKEMARKQEEVMQQMRVLQQKNESLERTLEEERAQKEALGATPKPVLGSEESGHGSDDAEPSPSQRRKASLIPLDEPSPAPSTPVHASSVKKSCRSARSYSLISSIDLGSTGRRLSAASRPAGWDRRLSAAQEALSAMQQGDGSERTHRLGDAPGGSGDIRSQRRWWAEQRQFLLEELYPQQAAVSSSLTAVGGLLPRAAGRTAGAGCAEVQANATVDVANGDAEALRCSEAVSIGGVAAGREVRNLSTMFEHVEDSNSVNGHLQPDSASGQCHRMVRSARMSQHLESKLKQPQYFWSKRRSVGGVDGMSAAA